MRINPIVLREKRREALKGRNPKTGEEIIIPAAVIPVFKDRDKLVAFFGGDEQKTDEEIKNIIMLLEIQSSSEVGFQWWDCGVIHFFIRKEDLENKQFDRTYLSLYSS